MWLAKTAPARAICWMTDCDRIAIPHCVAILYLMADLKPEKKTQLEAQLIASGVPENVANYAVEQSPKYRNYLLQSLIMFILMMAMFALGVFLWWLVEGVNNAKAEAATETIGALMYSTNFGVSFVIAVFGVIFLLLPILSYLQLFSKKWRTASFVYGMPDTNSGFSGPPLF